MRSNKRRHLLKISLVGPSPTPTPSGNSNVASKCLALESPHPCRIFHGESMDNFWNHTIQIGVKYQER